MIRNFALSLLAMTIATTALAEDKPAKVALDWASYNPTSIVLKTKGWLEEDLKKDGIAVEWRQSGGSNVAIGFLNSGKLDFGSTAGASSLVGKVDGAEIKTIYVYSKPEWVALVTRSDSPIKSVADLKGKRVAAPRGTDAHVFLVRALAEHGMATDDAKLVAMAHANGKAALLSGDIDAWAGLDPLMAEVELAGTGRLFYRKADFCTYGVLNVKTDFAAKYPSVVKRVLVNYEKARQWALANPAELVALMAEVTGIPKDAVAKQLGERTDLSNPVIGAAQREAIVAAGLVLQKAGMLPAGVDVAATADSLLDSSFLPQPVKF